MMILLRQNVSCGNEPILYIHSDVLSDGQPDGFIYGHRIEQQLADGTWQPLGEDEDESPDSYVRVRLRTGDMVCLEGADFVDEPSTDPRKARDGWMEETDAPGRLEDLPAGPFRFEGLTLTREQLLRLLPQLRPDLEGVLYPGETAGDYHFWTVGGETAVWHEYNHVMQIVAEQPKPEGPNVLLRVSYEDPLRPAPHLAFPQRTAYCVGYYRAVSGPLALEPVDFPQLSAHWPVEVLYDVLTSEELVLANLKPGPHEQL